MAARDPALCGTVLLGATAGARALDRAVGAGGRIASLPLSIPVGLLTAAVIERARAAVPEPTTAGPDSVAGPADDVPTVPGLAAGAAVIALLWGAGWAERWTAEQVRRLAPGPIPGSGLVWRLTSHAAFAAAAGVGVNALWSRAMQKIEAGSTAVDPWMQTAPGVWTHPMISGDPASLVSWDSLGREGRRHAVTFVRPEVVVDPPPLPDGRLPEDMSIPTVMGEPARAHPGAGLRRTRQRAHPDRAGRARHRRDGPHRCVVAVDAHARLADRHRLRQLRGGRRRAVPHPR